VRAVKAVGQLRSFRMSELGTYHGASTIMRKTLDWNRSRISMLEVEVVGLERGPLCLVSTTEELLDRKIAAPV
jgi:hypothetical protein